MGDLPGSDARITAAERSAQVVELRRMRLSFAQIGDRLGISSAAAWKAYQRALRMIPAPHVAEHRLEELGLIDDAIRNLLPLALKRDEPRDAIAAWQAILGWAMHKARILGLNAPVQVEVSDAINAEIAQLARQLALVDPAGTSEAPRDATPGGIPPAAT